MKYEVDAIDESIVTLDSYNSDLNLVIDASKYGANALTKEGFAFMWAGARATHGIKTGKVCFEVKIIEHLDVSHLPADEPNPHVVRVGFSVDSSSLQLGEEPLSYGYGGTGKISTNCQFKDFGPPFLAGDCILAAINMDSDPFQIGFAKNGNFIGWAYKIKKNELGGKALFPHILTKNCAFEVNFGQREQPFFLLPDALKGFVFISCLSMDKRIAGTRPPEKREDCEMIMMCGLPGAGKSYWAAEYSKKNPEKKYNVMGTNNIIDKMKVMGLPRKRNYHGRWDVLIQMATKCLNVLFSVGSKLRRNYILDQTNVYPTAQRRKMRNFDGFKRKAVVIVPTEEEFKRRCDKRDKEEGKEIPDSAVLEMKANFKLPEVNDVFDEVVFIELQRDEAEKLVKKYNEEGKAATGPSRKQFRSGDTSRDRGYDSGRGNYKRDDSFESKSGPRRFQDMPKDDQRSSGYGGRDRRDDFDNRRGGRGGFGDKGRFPDIVPRNFGERDNYGGGGRGGFDGNREGFGSFRGGRGGFGDNRGEFGDFRGSGRGRGNFGDTRGDFRGSGRGRGSFGDSRAEFGSFRGGASGRGGFAENRGGEFGDFRSSGDRFGSYDNSGYGETEGYDRGSSSYGDRNDYGGFSGRGESFGGMSRGNYDGGRGRGKGNFESRRGGMFDTSENANRTGSRQGYQDYDSSGQFGQNQEKYGQDYNMNETARSYQSYSAPAKYNEGNKIEYGHGTRGSTRGGYSASGRGNYSSTSYSDQKSDRGYGGNSTARGSSNGRFQRDTRGGGSSRGNYQSYSSSADHGSSVGAQSSTDKGYGYTSSSYGEPNKYQNTPNYASSYSAAPQTTGNSSQWSGASGMDSSKFSSGSTRSSGAPSRWSADTSQAPATASDSSYTSSYAYTTGGSQSYTYPQSYNQPSSQPPATSYQSSNQAYGYQQGVPSSTVTPQQWGSVPAATAPNPSNYSMPSQSTWSQYGQQPLTSTQYYTQ